MRQWLKRKRLTLAAVGLLILVAFGLWVYLRSSSDSAPGILEASGRIEGDQAAVGAKVGGRIVQLPVREGQALEAGQLIAELSSEQARAALEQAEHDLHTAREQIAQAEAQIAALKREVEAGETAVRLAEQQSRAQIGQAEAALETARARLRQAGAERERIGYMSQLFLSALFLFSSLGWGLFLGTLAENLQQALLLAFFSIFPILVISGTMVPVESMPKAIQLLSYLSPLTYYMEIGLGIFLKGVGMEVLWPQALAMGVLGVIVFAFGLLRFRKRLG